MSDQWFYKLFGQEFGPVSFNELKELADLATISATDEVRPDGSPNWSPAGSVSELGLESRVSPVPQPAALAVDSSHHGGAVADEWYYKFFDQEMGPIGFDEVMAITERGQLSADDEVKLGVDGKWRRVGSIGRLVAVLPFAAAQPKIAPPVSAASSPLKPSPTVNATGIPSAANSAAPANGSAVSGHQSQTVKKSAPQIAVMPAVSAAVTVADPLKLEPIQTPAKILTPSASSIIGEPSRSPTPAPSPVTSPASFPRPMPSKPMVIPSRKSSGVMLKALGSIAGVAVIALVLYVAVQVYAKMGAAEDIARYQKLKQLLDDVRTARAAKATDFQPYRHRAHKLTQELVPIMKRDASVEKPAKQSLLWAARDELPKMMNNDLNTESIHEKNFATRLSEAAKILGIK